MNTNNIINTIIALIVVVIIFLYYNADHSAINQVPECRFARDPVFCARMIKIYGDKH